MSSIKKKCVLSKVKVFPFVLNNRCFLIYSMLDDSIAVMRINRFHTMTSQGYCLKCFVWLRIYEDIYIYNFVNRTPVTIRESTNKELREFMLQRKPIIRFSFVPFSQPHCLVLFRNCAINQNSWEYTNSNTFRFEILFIFL